MGAPSSSRAAMTVRSIDLRAGRERAAAAERVRESEGRSPSDSFGTATGFCERLRRLFHWDSCVDRLGRAAPGAKNRRNNGPIKSIEDAREAGVTLVNAGAYRFSGLGSAIISRVLRLSEGRRCSESIRRRRKTDSSWISRSTHGKPCDRSAATRARSTDRMALLERPRSRCRQLRRDP